MYRHDRWSRRHSVDLKSNFRLRLATFADFRPFKAADLYKAEGSSASVIFPWSTVSRTAHEASIRQILTVYYRACVLELVRIVILEIDTDDSVDSSCRFSSRFVTRFLCAC